MVSCPAKTAGPKLGPIDYRLFWPVPRRHVKIFFYQLADSQIGKNHMHFL